MRNEPVKVGVIGVGHLGQHHVKHYVSLKDANLVGIVDTDQERAVEISKQFDIPVFNELQDLLKQVDAVSIVTPTLYHAKIAETCITNDIHVFIEKPITETLDIAHARIRFGNGTVASIMSSRVAKDEVRKVKLFQKNLYATIDLLLGLAEVYKIVGDPKEDPNALMTVPFEYNGAKRFIAYDKPATSDQDALGMELHNFIKSVRGKETPIVSGEAGRDALKIAIEIQQMITQDIH